MFSFIHRFLQSLDDADLAADDDEDYDFDDGGGDD